MNTAYFILYALGFSISWLALPFSVKVRTGLLGRMGLVRRIKWATSELGSKAVWVHVASAGELEQAFPILEQLKFKGKKVFLSYFSPSGKQALDLELRRRMDLNQSLCWDYADYSPFDFSFSVTLFLNALNPSHFICINREIWPGIIGECKRRNIPCSLLGVYFSPKSKRRLKFNKRWINQFGFVGTVDIQTANFLKDALDGPCIEYFGDPRIERILHRKTLGGRPHWAKYFESPVLLCGSICFKDFKNLKPSIELALEKNWRVILVPHEINNILVRRLIHYFNRIQAPVLTWRAFLNNPDRASVIIVNEVGLLAELYRVATVVFVG